MGYTLEKRNQKKADSRDRVRDLRSRARIELKKANKEMEKINKKFAAAKATLAKARPKIKQMRESIKFQKELDAGGAMPNIRKGQSEYRDRKIKQERLEGEMDAARASRAFIKQYAPKDKQADMLAKNEAYYQKIKKEWENL